MEKRRSRPATRSRKPMAGKTKRSLKPRGFSFKREAQWMTLMNVAPFVIGVVLALIFWLTR